jgi:hypothetical protein
MKRNNIKVKFVGDGIDIHDTRAGMLCGVDDDEALQLYRLLHKHRKKIKARADFERGLK